MVHRSGYQFWFMENTNGYHFCFMAYLSIYIYMYIYIYIYVYVYMYIIYVYMYMYIYVYILYVDVRISMENHPRRFWKWHFRWRHSIGMAQCSHFRGVDARRFMGGSTVMGVPQARWMVDFHGKIPPRDGWWLGVPLWLRKPPYVYIYIIIYIYVYKLLPPQLCLLVYNFL